MRRDDAPRDIRMTKQRKVILEVLKDTHEHPTADKVYEMVREKMPHISLGTVYRNLVLMSEVGLISKVEIGLPKRFDGTVESHYHIRCLGCGKVEDMKSLPIVDLRPAMRSLVGYEITGHRLDIYGYCPACRNKMPSHLKRTRL
jgi:Fur family ferric uptake transcriptional regulator